MVALTALLPAPARSASTPTPVAEPHVPRAVSLVGTELHLPGGKVRRLPKAAGRFPVLFGTTSRGWVVASGGAFRLVRPGGAVERITGRNADDLYVTEALSDDGTRVVSASFDQGDSFDLRVVDLDGTVVYDRSFSELYVDVLDAVAGTIWVGGTSGLFALDEATGGRTRLLRRPTALVDQGQDVVFVGTRKRPAKVGPTRLSEPGTPAWRARSRPVAVSPDGTHVVNDDGTVRAMADGRVVRRVPAPGSRDEFHFLGWASARRVLVETTAGGRSVLLSCPLPRGACRRVGTTGGRVSIPTTHAGPFLQP